MDRMFIDLPKRLKRIDRGDGSVEVLDSDLRIRLAIGCLAENHGGDWARVLTALESGQELSTTGFTYRRAD